MKTSVLIHLLPSVKSSHANATRWNEKKKGFPHLWSACLGKGIGRDARKARDTALHKFHRQKLLAKEMDGTHELTQKLSSTARLVSNVKVSMGPGEISTEREWWVVKGGTGKVEGCLGCGGDLLRHVETCGTASPRPSCKAPKHPCNLT